MPALAQAGKVYRVGLVGAGAPDVGLLGPTTVNAFAKRGYVAKQRNTVTINGEWLANTTMQKMFSDGASPGGTP